MALTVDEIKRLVLVALVSDDELMETIVLKGGNALSIGYDLGVRGSYDLDFSLEGDFNQTPEFIGALINQNLTNVFYEKGYVVFDYRFSHKPLTINENVADFWGGYAAEFKIISLNKFKKFSGDLELIRRNALAISPDNSTKFHIEFSKYEFITNKREIKVEGYTVFIYPPELLIYEKLRAICQQDPSYKEIVGTHHARGRARDFYDIHTIRENLDVIFDLKEARNIIKSVFDAKRVPLSFINKIGENRALHEQEFSKVRDTVSPIEREQMKEFEYYFNYIIELFTDVYMP